MINRAAYSYDSASRLLVASEYDSTLANVGSAGYRYLTNSSLVDLISMTNGSVERLALRRQFDSLNRLSSVVSTSSAVALPYAYTYNALDQRTRRSDPGGAYWNFDYDSLGQLRAGRKYWSSGSPVPGQQFEYAFDDIGNRISSKAGGDQNGANLRTSTYGVDSLNRYTSRTVPGAVDIMGIGLATNVVTVTNANSLNNAAASYRNGEYFRKEVSLNNTNNGPLWELVSIAANGATTINGNAYVPRTPEQFGYDADGNLTNDGRWAYAWDAENRLVQMLPSGTVTVPDAAKRKIQFTYDAQGRRIQKSVCAWNGSGWSIILSNRFLYDGWNVVAELNATNNSRIRTYLWGNDLSCSLQGAGGVGGLLEVSYYGSQTTNSFAGYDGNGNLTVLVDASNAAEVSRYEYGPFGEVIRATGPMAKANPFRFSTKYQDDESDLLYYGYRYYNASTGRWISRDPLGDEAFVRGGVFLAKRKLHRNAITVEEHSLGFITLRSTQAASLISGPKGFSSLLHNRSTSVAIAREVSNPYQFVLNAPIVFIDQRGLKPCSSCSAADIQKEAIARGLEYIHRSIEENREYGGRICCNDCMSRIYSANVVQGPIDEGTVTTANSKCRLGDRIVADWHTHPDGSTQTGDPNGQRSDDKRNVTFSAAPTGFDCDFVGFMTNNHLDTTRMDSQGNETTVDSRGN